MSTSFSTLGGREVFKNCNTGTHNYSITNVALLLSPLVDHCDA